jgi:hypothetical protein
MMCVMRAYQSPVFYSMRNQSFLKSHFDSRFAIRNLYRFSFLDIKGIPVFLLRYETISLDTPIELYSYSDKLIY